MFNIIYKSRNAAVVGKRTTAVYAEGSQNPLAHVCQGHKSRQGHPKLLLVQCLH